MNFDSLADPIKASWHRFMDGTEEDLVECKDLFERYPYLVTSFTKGNQSPLHALLKHYGKPDDDKVDSTLELLETVLKISRRSHQDARIFPYTENGNLDWHPTRGWTVLQAAIFYGCNDSIVDYLFKGAVAAVPDRENSRSFREDLVANQTFLIAIILSGDFDRLRRCMTRELFHYQFRSLAIMERRSNSGTESCRMTPFGLLFALRSDPSSDKPTVLDALKFTADERLPERQFELFVTHEESATAGKEKAALLPLENRDEIRIECTNWSEDGFLELLRRIATVKELKVLSLHVPERLASLRSIREAFRRLLRSVPRETEFKLVGYAPVFLPDYRGTARVLANALPGSNVTKVQFGLLRDDPITVNGVALGIILSHCPEVEFAGVTFGRESLQVLVNAIRNLATPESVKYIRITDCGLAPGVALQPPRATEAPELPVLRELCLTNVEHDLCARLTQYLGSRRIASLRWLDMSVPVLQHLLPRSIHAEVDITSGTDVDADDIVSDLVAGIRDATRLSKLELKMKLDLSPNGKVSLSNAIADSVSHGRLKDLCCPLFVLTSAELDGRWDKLHSLRFERLPRDEAEADKLFLSLSAFAKRSDSLVMLKTRYGGQQEAQLNHLVACNIVGLAKLTQQEEVSMKDVVAVIDQVQHIGGTPHADFRYPFGLDAHHLGVILEIVLQTTVPLASYVRSNPPQLTASIIIPDESGTSVGEHLTILGQRLAEFEITS